MNSARDWYKLTSTCTNLIIPHLKYDLFHSRVEEPSRVKEEPFMDREEPCMDGKEPFIKKNEPFIGISRLWKEPYFWRGGDLERKQSGPFGWSGGGPSCHPCEVAQIKAWDFTISRVEEANSPL